MILELFFILLQGILRVLIGALILYGFCLFVDYLVSKSIKEKPPVKKGKIYNKYMELSFIRQVCLFAFYSMFFLFIYFLFQHIFHIVEISVGLFMVALVPMSIGMLGNLIGLIKQKRLK